MPDRDARDTTFATLALLRCRERIPAILEAVAEGRREALACAVADLEALTDPRLKELLMRTVQQEDVRLRDQVARELGESATKVSKAVRKLAAHAFWP